jgi:hypothetical protein
LLVLFLPCRDSIVASAAPESVAIKFSHGLLDFCS